ncbi:M20 family metallopeptidase [Paenibacillus kribbensis]|uniref:M20 family metallopeptidase n=1 Tax=Paenibacillus kribbensis TaxID=172713 RepID=UPI0009FBDB08|nr:M20 family metallopeptidase [Paenibacillus kribbensis]
MKNIHEAQQGGCEWFADRIERGRESFTEISDHIWKLAESKFEEFESADLLAGQLEHSGFRIERCAAGLPTAFVGSYGSGSPVIAVLGEFDALPNMSQQAGVAVKQALEHRGNGHGCGHHLLGTGALAAVVAVKEYMEERGLPGTIRYYGCPAEEGGSGKTFMVREGLFDDVDAALTWHPGYNNGVVSQTSVANYQIRYRFLGKSAHAGISPHKGRSALDAVELMNVGANYMREHIPPEARFHYAVTETGGEFPNVVQAEAEVVYLIRAPELRQVEEIYHRMNDVAKGAALMTGTEVDIRFEKACSNLIPNVTLEQVMYRCFTHLGVPVFTEAEQSYASEILSTLQQGRTDAENGGSLPETLDPYEPASGRMLGSTDVSDVSWVVPTAQLETVCYASETPFHSWQMVAQGMASASHKGMLHAAKVMAATAAELLMYPGIMEEAKQELKARGGGMEGYNCPIPAHVKPSVKERPSWRQSE